MKFLPYYSSYVPPMRVCHFPRGGGPSSPPTVLVLVKCRSADESFSSPFEEEGRKQEMFFGGDQGSSEGWCWKSQGIFFPLLLLFESSDLFRALSNNNCFLLQYYYTTIDLSSILQRCYIRKRRATDVHFTLYNVVWRSKSSLSLSLLWLLLFLLPPPMINCRVVRESGGGGRRPLTLYFHRERERERESKSGGGLEREKASREKALASVCRTRATISSAELQ